MAARVREVVWAESARDALDAVITYIAQDSQASAVQVLEEALRAGASLAMFSERGRIVPVFPALGGSACLRLSASFWTHRRPDF